ncbi:LuxR C-terminal-related transcriptional regulator [Carboxylicivirga marina]|uniref:Response regulator transcription factor n=1 Tax=Carboxylicivirga marina TaxID=2800988 RepID=A0ABS1HH07_9BACT|nr:LuxR C-terminal-related transcriptional regulator [Carboxylicivirga marina]MBK3516951.1 response regulator transcription factor [Carboxylicivirga marina]
MEINRKRILFISSIDKHQKELATILFQLGFNLVAVTDLETAIQKSSVSVPDIILCDGKVDEYSALEIFNILERRIVHKRIPFILISTNFNSAELLMAEELGIDGFLFPPFEADNVKNIIERQFQKRDYHTSVAENKYKTVCKLIPYAVFVAENRRIIEGNTAFKKTFGYTELKTKQPFLKELFNFRVNETEEMKYIRFQNGLLKDVVFTAIPAIEHPEKKYRLHLIYVEQSNNVVQIIGMAKPVKNSQPNSNELVNDCFCTLPVPSYAHHSKEENKMGADSILTKREKQILQLSAKGIPIKQIADQLGISVRTVEKHRSNVIQKTNSGNIIGAVHIAKTKYSL